MTHTVEYFIASLSQQTTDVAALRDLSVSLIGTSFPRSSLTFFL